jgi:hypothetical protein
MALGRYPTPVERQEVAAGELWVKRDDLTSPRYGGNKVRKLERVLQRVRALGVRRIVTVGAAGSHHALATALYARDFGIDVEAVLVPQQYTPHVAENLRVIASLARIFPATSFAHAAAIIVDRVACSSYYVPAGGSTRDSSVAYADAAAELLAQVDRGELRLWGSQELGVGHASLRCWSPSPEDGWSVASGGSPQDVGEMSSLIAARSRVVLRSTRAISGQATGGPPLRAPGRSRKGSGSD